MAMQVELSPEVCSDCPLVGALNAAWADYELFAPSAELDNFQLPGAARTDEPNKHMQAVVDIYEAQMEKYNQVLGALSEYVISQSCPGKQEGSWTGTFCGVEGNLRSIGVVVPEY